MPITRERVYELDIVNTRTTYQFTRAFALRGIAQYDSSRKRVLTDFLGPRTSRGPARSSMPGTASLLEQREFVNGAWVPGVGEYRTTQRGAVFQGVISVPVLTPAPVRRQLPVSSCQFKDIDREIAKLPLAKFGTCFRTAAAA